MKQSSISSRETVGRQTLRGRS